MSLKITTWQWLLSEEGQSLVAKVANEPHLDHPSTVMRLRKNYLADQVSAAISLVKARAKAGGKFDDADQLVADPVGIEQASGSMIANHKAKRFAQLFSGGGATSKCVYDLCCGIGGDAMSLAMVSEVVAVDNQPLKAWMTAQNMKRVCQYSTESLTEDVTKMQLNDAIFHLDPSRRNERGRVWHYEDYQPGPDFIDDLLERCPTGAIKLSPGIDVDELPMGEVEFISVKGHLLQAVLWTGNLASHEARATLLPTGQTLFGEPSAVVQLGQPLRYLYTIDPAVERANLIHLLIEETDALGIHPRTGLLTSDQLIDNGFLTPFELHAAMPWRLKKVKAWLGTHDGGIVEVKTRGKAVNPDQVQQQLRGKGEVCFTVFVLRLGDKVQAFICKRLCRVGRGAEATTHHRP